MSASKIEPTVSRFYQRWLAAAPERAAQSDAAAEVALDQIDLADYLQREASAGASLARRPAAGARHAPPAQPAGEWPDPARSGGQANLNEVVTAMTRFADFAIARHVDELMAELVAAHGMPIGRDSGRHSS
jgi:glutamate-ammonia-ligase adenylyltransferase